MQRIKYLVDCTIMMKCEGLERYRDAERALTEAGFQSRLRIEGDTTCTLSLVREFFEGSADALRDSVCETLAKVVSQRVGDWKAFV